jgi:MFS-type transporter involved in bile tolerance (Atg22 family)
MSGGRTVLVVAALIAVIGLLFTVAFPWLDRMLVTNPVLGGG